MQLESRHWQSKTHRAAQDEGQIDATRAQVANQFGSPLHFVNDGSSPKSPQEPFRVLPRVLPIHGIFQSDLEHHGELPEQQCGFACTARPLQDDTRGFLRNTSQWNRNMTL